MPTPEILPAAHLSNRIEQARKSFAAKGLDAILLTHAPDIAYLSDFSGEDSVALLTSDQFRLVTDPRYTEQARLEAGWLPITLRDGKLAKMHDAVVECVGQTSATRIGFDPNFVSFGVADAVRMKLAGLKPTRELVPTPELVVGQRKVKDSIEIELIRNAIKIAEESLIALLPALRAGDTENFIAGALQFEMRKRGATNSSFQTIAAVGAAAALPHYRPRQNPLVPGQVLLIDFGALAEGYCSDLTRTYLVGKVSAKMEEIYKVALEAQLSAIDAIKPGAMTHEVDAVARRVIAKAGFDKYFGHGLGHGIGRDIHELPRLSPAGTNEPLQPGHVVTVEPGIYLPGEGGVRIEDDVLVTDNGCQVLSSLDKSFDGARLML